MLVRLLPLRLTQAFHLEHLHRSESQLFGIELQLRSHLNGQRWGASEGAGRFLGRRAGRNCQARPLEPQKQSPRNGQQGTLKHAVAPLIGRDALADARAELIPR